MLFPVLLYVRFWISIIGWFHTWYGNRLARLFLSLWSQSHIMYYYSNRFRDYGANLCISCVYYLLTWIVHLDDSYGHKQVNYDLILNSRSAAYWKHGICMLSMTALCHVSAKCYEVLNYNWVNCPLFCCRNILVLLITDTIK